MKKLMIGVVAIALASVGIAILLQQNSAIKKNIRSRVTCADDATLIARIGPYVFTLDSADTPKEHAQGLSGRSFLPLREGLLFVFGESRVQRFWMKDMLFPIHMLWIDQDFVIQGVAEHADPSSYPTIFSSPVPVPYVLEVHADALPNIQQYVHTVAHFSCMQKPAV